MGEASSDEPVLTEEEEIKVEKDIYERYRIYLDKIIGDESGSCSEQIYVPYIMFVKDGQIVGQPGEGARTFQLPKAVLTLDEFRSVFRKFPMSNDVYIVQGFKNQTKESVALLDSMIKHLCENRYFLLSVRLVVIGSKVSHQTILAFDAEKKVCIVIEPKLRVQSVVQLYQNLLERLKLTEFTLVEPPDTCVQAIAEDKNCMYWSLLLAARYLKGDATSIKDVSDSILKETGGKEGLKKYVNTFKRYLYESIRQNEIPLSESLKAGKRWATSMVNRSRRRHRRRLHRQRKTNSRSSRNARRTRRRM